MRWYRQHRVLPGVWRNTGPTSPVVDCGWQRRRAGKIAVEPGAVLGQAGHHGHERWLRHRSLYPLSETPNPAVNSPDCPDCHMFRRKRPSAEVPDPAESASKAHVIKPGRARARSGGDLDTAWSVASTTRSHRCQRMTKWFRNRRPQFVRILCGSGDPDKLTHGRWRRAPDADDRPCPQCDAVPVDSVARSCGGTSTRNEASTLKPAVANRKRARSICPVFQSTRGAFCSRDLMPTQGAGSGRSKFPRTPAYRQCAGARARRSHRLGSLRLSRRIRQPREKRLGARRAGN